MVREIWKYESWVRKSFHTKNKTLKNMKWEAQDQTLWQLEISWTQKILSSINLDKDIIKMDRIHKMGGWKSLYALLDISTRLQRGLCWSTVWWPWISQMSYSGLNNLLIVWHRVLRVSGCPFPIAAKLCLWSQKLEPHHTGQRSIQRYVDWIKFQNCYHYMDIGTTH